MKTAGLIVAGIILGVGAAHAEVKPGAKAGDVWTNGTTYHCPATRYFGTTKVGQYMPEAAAAKAGAKPARGKTCAEVAAAKAGGKTAAKPASAGPSKPAGKVQGKA